MRAHSCRCGALTVDSPPLAPGQQWEIRTRDCSGHWAASIIYKDSSGPALMDCVRAGLARWLRRWAGKRKDAGSTPRFGSPFSSKIVICGHCLVTFSGTVIGTVKWLFITARLNAEIILVVTVYSGLHISSLSPLSPMERVSSVVARASLSKLPG